MHAAVGTKTTEKQKHNPQRLNGQHFAIDKTVVNGRGETMQQCIVRMLEQYFADLDGAQPHALLEMVMQAVERPLLQFAMHKCDGNQSAAADLLGINRNTLRKKLQEHHLIVEE